MAGVVIALPENKTPLILCSLPLFTKIALFCALYGHIYLELHLALTMSFYTYMYINPANTFILVFIIKIFKKN